MDLIFFIFFNKYRFNYGYRDLIMKQKNRYRKNKNEKRQTKKIIRCKNFKQPVFDHEVCFQFSGKIDSNNIKNCDNCKHSF